VVHLNALAISAAITEIVFWISGSRAPADWLDVDLQGATASPGTLIGPRRVCPRDDTCIAGGRNIRSPPHREAEDARRSRTPAARPAARRAMERAGPPPVDVLVG
jgi:hypothetical protein